MTTSTRRTGRGLLGAAGALALLGMTGLGSLGLGGVTAARADAPVTMAPPGYSQDADSPLGNVGPGDAAGDSVFQWNEVPQNQRVPLTRAVFDRSGYQLYDTAGETVLVPFTNNNLYVMKFAPSDDGTLYLVNGGDAPVLYVPQGAFLENADVPGARWYPFPDDFHPARPVYLGVAPSWSAFVSLGWAPDLVIRGGYWGRSSFVAGGVFLPSAGLVFEFGGRRYEGWEPYHSYVVAHPDRFRFEVVDRGRVDRPHVFRGGGPVRDGYARDGYARDGYAHDGYAHDGYARSGDHGRRVFRGARGADRRDRH